MPKGHNGKRERHEGGTLREVSYLYAMHFMLLEDVLKLQFTLDAMDYANPFVNTIEVPESVKDAIWYASFHKLLVLCRALALQVVRGKVNRPSHSPARIDDTLDRGERRAATVSWNGNVCYLRACNFFAGRMANASAGARMQAARSEP